MRRICLVRCPSPFLIDERVFPPLGLMAVGTALKNQGHKVHIFDGALEDIPLDFHHYGFGPTIPEYAFARDGMRRIRQYNPKAKIVIGGPYATLNSEKCLKDGFDTVVCGDGELVVNDAFMNGGGTIVAKERPLDEYPMIDRTVLDLNRYTYILNDRPATTMMTSQGCPFKCAFCCKNYKTVRFKSIPKVVEEIKTIHFDFGFNAIAFPEDLFIISKERTEEICRHLKDMGIIWRCLIRADLAVKYGKEFVQMMADSGCVSVGMGIESGSDRILKIINKGETSSTMRAAVRLLKDAGINVKGFFIVGLPGENYDTLNETRAFLDEAKLHDVDIKIFQPYVGSPIWENKDKFDIDWDDDLDFEKLFYKGRFGEYYGNIRTSSLTTEQIYREWMDMEGTYKCQ